MVVCSRSNRYSQQRELLRSSKKKPPTRSSPRAATTASHTDALGEPSLKGDSVSQDTTATDTGRPSKAGLVMAAAAQAGASTPSASGPAGIGALAATLARKKREQAALGAITPASLAAAAAASAALRRGSSVDVAAAEEDGAVAVGGDDVVNDTPTAVAPTSRPPALGLAGIAAAAAAAAKARSGSPSTETNQSAAVDEKDGEPKRDSAVVSGGLPSTGGPLGGIAAAAAAAAAARLGSRIPPESQAEDNVGEESTAQSQPAFPPETSARESPSMSLWNNVLNQLQSGRSSSSNSIPTVGSSAENPIALLDEDDAVTTEREVVDLTGDADSFRSASASHDNMSEASFTSARDEDANES